MAQKENGKSEKKSVKMTLRMDESMDAVLEKISRSSGLTKSEVVRFALADRLAEYLGNVIYVTDDEAVSLRKALYDMCTEMSNVYRQLKRIGNNFNQYVRNQNAARLSGNSFYDEKGKAADETLKQISEVMDKYTQETRKVTEAVQCLIRQ